jgi:DnaA family protein
LGIQLPREPRLGQYVPGPNAEALGAVGACAEGRGEPYVYLWGAGATGKTHLLLGACAHAQARGRQGFYLDLERRLELSVEMLVGLERLDLVCLDDVHRVAGDPDWEVALFDLFNRLRDTDVRLLVAGNTAASELPLQLPDLRSRLGWGPGFRLRPLDDDARLEWLHGAAAARGIPLRNEAARYILTRCKRDLRTLDALLDRLDRISLAEQRRPSIGLIQRAMEDLQGA